MILEALNCTNCGAPLEGSTRTPKCGYCETIFEYDDSSKRKPTALKARLNEISGDKNSVITALINPDGTKRVIEAFRNEGDWTIHSLDLPKMFNKLRGQGRVIRLS